MLHKLLDWPKYRTIPISEPPQCEFVWDATPAEIARARILGITDAIRDTDPLHIALQLYSDPDDFDIGTWRDLLIDEFIYDEPA